MSKIIEKNNRFVKIFLSFALVLILMFSLILPAFNVSAYDRYNYSSSHHGQGMHRYNGTIITNDLTLHRIQMALVPFISLFTDIPSFNTCDDQFFIDLYLSLSDWAKEYLVNIANSLSDSYSFFLSLRITDVSSLCGQIRNFLISYTSNNTTTFIPLDHHYSKLGFTSDSTFSFTLSSDQSTYNSLYYVDFGKSVFSFGGVQKDYITSRFPELNYPDTTKPALLQSLTVNSSGLTYVCFTASSTTSNRLVYGGTYTAAYPGINSTFGSSYVLASNNIDNNNILQFISGTNKIYIKAQSGHSWYSGFYYDNTYYYLDSVNGGYSLLNVYTGAPYQNLVFSSSLDFWVWFYNSCGLVLPTSVSNSVSDYSPSNPEPFPYDDSSYPDHYNLITNNTDSDGVVHMVFPGDFEQADILNQDTDYIFNVSKASDLVPIYPYNLPVIPQVPELYTTKFPFCIPYDIYNLFSSWDEPDAVAPEFHFVIFPEDSFNLDNDEIAIDFDFEDFEIFIVILRYFLIFGYTFFLIFFTVKLFKGGGG